MSPDKFYDNGAATEGRPTIGQVEHRAWMIVGAALHGAHCFQARGYLPVSLGTEKLPPANVIGLNVRSTTRTALGFVTLSPN